MLGAAAAAFFYLVLLASSSFATSSPKTPFFAKPPRAVEALMGGSADFLHPAGWLASAMAHPITLALFTSAALVVSAGAIAAELERGTIDFVLSRPVGRLRFLMAKAAAALTAVTFVEAMGLAGALIARATITAVGQIGLLQIARLFAGSWLLFAAFSMVGLFISSRSSLRGRATAASAGVVVVAFFTNFAALLIDGIYPLRFISPFHYFAAAEVMSGSGLWALTALAGLALAAAGGAVFTFAHRDLTR